MNASRPDFLSTLPLTTARFAHRYMESADINAAFCELFRVLRAHVRRGMTNRGQLYALEMDPCAPGELLGSDWIPPPSRGVADVELLEDEPLRRELVRQLLAEPRAEALIAYICERADLGGAPQLYVEVSSAHARHAASYPIRCGHGWYERELLAAPHRRVDLPPAS